MVAESSYAIFSKPFGKGVQSLLLHLPVFHHHSSISSKNLHCVGALSSQILKIHTFICLACFPTHQMLEEPLPFWQVNVPFSQREERCPEYLLNICEKDKQIIATPDGEFKCMTWPEVKELVRMI